MRFPLTPEQTRHREIFPIFSAHIKHAVRQKAILTILSLRP
jgi:hypothetical protein